MTNKELKVLERFLSTATKAKVPEDLLAPVRTLVMEHKYVGIRALLAETTSFIKDHAAEGFTATPEALLKKCDEHGQ